MKPSIVCDEKAVEIDPNAPRQAVLGEVVEQRAGRAALNAPVATKASQPLQKRTGQIARDALDDLH